MLLRPMAECSHLKSELLERATLNSVISDSNFTIQFLIAGHIFVVCVDPGRNFQDWQMEIVVAFLICIVFRRT
jgi:hypothetical protein